MSEWKAHDGKGVPADAMPGVTFARYEAPAFAVWKIGSDEEVWNGTPEPWDWSNYCTVEPTTGYRWGRIIAYRNPSAKSVEALKAIAADPKAKFRKLVDA